MVPEATALLQAHPAQQTLLHHTLALLALALRLEALRQAVRALAQVAQSQAMLQDHLMLHLMHRAQAVDGAGDVSHQRLPCTSRSLLLI